MDQHNSSGYYPSTVYYDTGPAPHHSYHEQHQPDLGQQPIDAMPTYEGAPVCHYPTETMIEPNNPTAAYQLAPPAPALAPDTYPTWPGEGVSGQYISSEEPHQSLEMCSGASKPPDSLAAGMVAGRSSQGLSVYPQQPALPQQLPLPAQQQQHGQEQAPVYYSDSPAHSSNHAHPAAMQSSASISVEWLDNICKQLIEHMNTFGICVIDNFLGSLCGDDVLKEVYHLYNNGLFRRGQLVNNRLVNGRVHLVRGDSIIWVDGSESECQQIGQLIQTLDSIIIHCNKMSGNNGEFDSHVINQRTKAMIACYPGNGTHYIKHIDNPNGDGRCITAIYYLNKDWDVQLHGGLLRIFPVGIDEVANIAPLFDRVLFFWSDRRNPHEVQPAQRIRFAITVWFIDSNEKQRRQQEQQRLKLQQQQRERNQLYQFNCST